MKNMEKDLLLILKLKSQIDILMATEDLDTAKAMVADILVTINKLEPGYQRELKPLRDLLEKFLGKAHFDICLD